MANNSPTLRELLAIASKDYFWSCSTVRNSFRPSEIFNQILQGYLDKLKNSHSRNRVHNWRTSLMDNIIIRNNDTANIRLGERPVRVNDGEDFDYLRRRDYARLANLIEEVHSASFLPDISLAHSPELMNFLHLLREPLQFVDQIHKHYCLWGFTRRRHFMIDLRYRQAYKPFNKMTSHQIEAMTSFRFEKYPDGFWRRFDNDAFLTDIMDGDPAGGTQDNRPYKNTLAGFIKFIRDMFIHCSPNGDLNFYCASDMEWRIYEEFPFYLHLICQILLSLDLLFAYE